MKRIHGLLSGLAASLLLCACGAGDEEGTHAGDLDAVQAPAPSGSEDRASEQPKAAQATADIGADRQTAVVVIPNCTSACVVVSSSNLTGACCICNGAQKTFHRSAWSRTTYLCQ